jgi:hypothetical protein
MAMEIRIFPSSSEKCIHVASSKEEVQLGICVLQKGHTGLVGYNNLGYNPVEGVDHSLLKIYSEFSHNKFPHGGLEMILK